jgi:hypothetical protein
MPEGKIKQVNPHSDNPIALYVVSQKLIVTNYYTSVL